MKRLMLIMVVMLLFTGCLASTPQFTIPDEPYPTQFKIYQVEGGVCFDNQGLKVLRDNINDLKDYADKMRKILMDIQKGQ